LPKQIVARINKLQKFAEIREFPNVYECYEVQQPVLTAGVGRTVDLKGQWAATHFGNQQPITLELACGGGEYVIGLATAYPERNFIGVDVKGNRLWAGAKTALAQQLHNAAFLRTRIEVITEFFAVAEIDEIWITFADPFPRHGKENRRLTSPHFLDQFRKILRPGGLVHVKHDDPDFYAFTLDTLRQDPRCNLLYHSDDIYAAPLAYPELAYKTLYEEKHLANGRRIKYVRYQIH
jgi:tRNA (guanine-N7-)-methyltransferase